MTKITRSSGKTELLRGSKKRFGGNRVPLECFRNLNSSSSKGWKLASSLLKAKEMVTGQ